MEVALTLTSLLPTYKPKKNSSGFTLIEVLVVLAIVSAITAVIVRQTRDTRSKARVTMRQLSVLTKQLHSMARYQGKTFRLAIQIDKKKGHQFWVESGYPKKLLKSQDQIEDEEKGFKKEGAEGAPAPDFAQDPTILKNKIELPNGLFFEDVEVKRLKEKVTEGMAYITFFPQGLSEEAAIHLTDGKNAQWTIMVHALTGQGKLFAKYVSLAEYRK